jgi:hypothetical protein
VQPDQVAGALDREAGGQGAGLGQVRGQGGGAGQPLAVDGGRERLELALAGAGGGQQDADQRAGPLRHCPAERGVAGELGQARQLGWVPPSPAFLVRSALARRRLRGQS